jgi:hypothetical protein
MAYACIKKHNSDLKRRYKITRRVHQAILEGQQYLCAICQGHQLGVGTLVMEHDDTTGVLRSACCPACNAVLGFSKENTGTLKNAIKYIEES